MKIRIASPCGMILAFILLCSSSCSWSASISSSCESIRKERDTRINIFVSRLSLTKPDPSLPISLIKEIYSGNVNALKNRLDSGLDANFAISLEKPEDKTPLLGLAILACQPAVAIELVNHGANVNGDREDTPLVDAASLGIDEMVSFLLSHGAKLEKRSEQGLTALTASVRGKNFSTVRILLQHGANPNHPVNGHSVLRNVEVSEDGGREISELLRSYGAIDF